MLIVFGGRLIRNDLRQDMQHLPLLKTLPIAPGDLMLAEVASGALPMAALQIAAAARRVRRASFRLRVGSASPRTSARAPRRRAVRRARAQRRAADDSERNGGAVSRRGFARARGEHRRRSARAERARDRSPTCSRSRLALIVPGDRRVRRGERSSDRRASRRCRSSIIVASVVLAAETYGALRLLGSRLRARGAAADGVSARLTPFRPRVITIVSARATPTVPCSVVEPLAVRVRVAAASAGADRDRRNALTDRHIRVGGREREVGLTADEPRRRDRRLHERVLGRRLAARPRADRFDGDA